MESNGFLRYLLILISLIFFIGETLWGQSYFYNTQQFGMRSTLLGGSMIAGGEDLTMVYYNPAALRYVKNKSLNLALIVPSYGVNSFRDYFKAGTNTRDRDFNLNGNLLTLKTSIKKLDLVFTILKKTDWSNSIKYSGTSMTNNVQKDEAFYYSFSGGERWYGIGSHRSLNEHVSIGISHFWSAFNTKYSYVFQSEATDLLTKEKQEFFSETLDLSYSSSFSMVTKIGLSIYQPKNRFGFVITTPNYLPISKSGSFEKTTIDLIQGDYNVINIIDYKIDPEIKSPWEFKIGYSRLFPDSTDLSISASFNTRVPSYTIFTASDVNEAPLQLKGEVKGIANVSFGISKKINPKLEFLSSFRTNFFAYKNKATRAGEQRMYILDANKYQMVAGFKLDRDNSSIVIGIDWAFSASKNYKIFKNFPNIERLDNKTNSKYTHNILTLMITYKFILDSVSRNINRILDDSSKRDGYKFRDDS